MRMLPGHGRPDQEVGGDDGTNGRAGAAPVRTPCDTVAKLALGRPAPCS